jgi:hypothetical protein
MLHGPISSQLLMQLLSISFLNVWTFICYINATNFQGRHYQKNYSSIGAVASFISIFEAIFSQISFFD